MTYSFSMRTFGKVMGALLAAVLICFYILRFLGWYFGNQLTEAQGIFVIVVVAVVTPPAVLFGSWILKKVSE